MEYLRILNPVTKKAQVFTDKVKSFCSDSGLYCLPSLYTCYSKPSLLKVDAYIKCVDFCKKYVKARNDNGANSGIKDYGIISYYSNFFTFACIVSVYATAPEINGKWLYDYAIIITPSKMFEIIL